MLFPVWLSFFWRRGAGRFAAAFFLSASISLAVASLFLLEQTSALASLQSTLNLAEWQAWRVPTTDSFWKGIHWAYRIPVFIAFLAFVISTIF